MIFSVLAMAQVIGCGRIDPVDNGLDWKLEVASLIADDFEFRAWRGDKIRLGPWDTAGKEKGLRAVGAPEGLKVTVREEGKRIVEPGGKGIFFLIRYQVGEKTYECSADYSHTTRFKSWTTVYEVDWTTGEDSVLPESR